MTECTSHAPGTFSWFELSTSDQKAATDFYTALFGWTHEDVPMGPDGVYTILKLKGRDVGALCTMQPAVAAMGVPPHWLLYIAVADADETAAKITANGGRLMMAPFDVMDLGRMCVAQDPQGASFAIWQARKHHGVGISGESNSPCWSELETNDVAGAKAFYGGVFGWEGSAGAGGGMTYTEWKMPGTKPFGGMMLLPPEWGPIPPHWMTYYRVDDCDALVARAKELGGSVKAGPMDAPNVGRFAVVADPQGAIFSVIKLSLPEE